MTGKDQGNRNAGRSPAEGSPMARGRLGTGMMSDDAQKGMDIMNSPSAADEGAEAGSDMATELDKTGAADRAKR
ncbi:MAG TPA: hypothetical protein VGD08_09760 [Stellaceae bacterium]|jgi:hypothetical protein